ncbi:DEAD/DEAH box helicase [Bacteroidia bacterium]|nr:DEAD/DEAH box helicase [Bacteroidia bacterium]MDB9881669.1 DEAD/DEAH box helicase [Bacteroidia bacterium]MDC1395401.1 DEAD/DEAH box helicase [Bacteroidia bacterium]
MTFNDLGLTEALLKAVADKGYETPSPIQEKAIPRVLEGKDVLASAQTGTGKTAGFAIPMIQLLCKEPPKNKRVIRALVLTPTRELAAQVLEDIVTYSKYTDLRSMVIFGGVNQNPQVNKLRAGIDILVATPGRLMDLQNQGFISLEHIEFLVLDEADRMLDMGFLRDIKRIMSKMPLRRQNLLFSATFSREIRALANGILTNPVTVEATPENTTAELVNQLIYRCDAKRKTELITKLIWDGNWHQVLVFTRTKHGANRLAEKLNKAKITAAAIHGNKSQGARTRALAGFKSKEISVLVATDIAARGLDIPLLPYVINFELPNVPEDYVHRIGRTGRAGASGQAISLVSADEAEYVRGIEKLLGMRLESEVIEGFEPTKGPVEGGKKRVQGRGRNDNRGRNTNSNSQSNSRNRNGGGNGGNRNFRRKPRNNSGSGNRD